MLLNELKEILEAIIVVEIVKTGAAKKTRLSPGNCLVKKLKVGAVLSAVNTAPEIIWDGKLGRSGCNVPVYSISEL